MIVENLLILFPHDCYLKLPPGVWKPHCSIHPGSHRTPISLVATGVSESCIRNAGDDRLSGITRYVASDDREGLRGIRYIKRRTVISESAAILFGVTSDTQLTASRNTGVHNGGSRSVRILGTHGIPAAYGGFETAAENIARHLTRRGWDVTVYCQTAGSGARSQDVWQGITRVNIPIKRDGWLGTAQFDLKSIFHASRDHGPCLTFGYNTALFNILQKLRRIPNAINMDGIEWSRARWGRVRQGILYANERIGCRVGDVLIADHPEIENYLAGRAKQSKIEMITYGADRVDEADTSVCAELGVTPGRYFSLIARAIPENSILEIVRGFSRRPRGVKLVVLGDYTESDEYHREVLTSASAEVLFPGSIYDTDRVRALRFHSLGYLHGHTVGGTNPSLVESLAAGNPVIAHDNVYNRWVARDAGRYFTDEDDVDALIDEFIRDEDLPHTLGDAAYARHAEEFTWEHIAGQYENVLLRLIGSDVAKGG